MPHNRFYLAEPFEISRYVTLYGDEAHHLLRVLRAHVGDQVELVNGWGALADAQIVSMGKQKVELKILDVLKKDTRAKTILAQAIPKMSHLEWIIEKGTELNASSFWLFPGQLSEKKSLNEHQLARLRSLSIAGMKQSGRLDLPEILIKPPLLEWAEDTFRLGTCFFGDTEREAPYLWDILTKRSLKDDVLFFIGPEKGFAPVELVWLRHTLMARGVRLHPNILRAETAPLVALANIEQFIC